MSRKEFLGEFEQMVMLAVLRLGEQAYGVAIRREIERTARRQVSRGAVYATLDRLEIKELMFSRFGDPTPERGGKSKKYFLVTAQGLVCLKSSGAALSRMWDGLQPILGDL